MPKSYRVVGLMSGTSLDGLDLVLVDFYQDKHWHYQILKTDTVAYNLQWTEKLSTAQQLSGLELIKLHHQYGNYLGEQVRNFVLAEQPIDFVASHGHTIFHQPSAGFTFQLGHGANIAATSGIDVIADFRVTDVVLGGQGAPLVPIGDELLFGQYDYCLNLGGFANISFQKDGQRLAFDICPVNYVLNYLSEKNRQNYDKDGQNGRKGSIIPDLLEKLNALTFYRQAPPKSLGREWVEDNIFNLLDYHKHNINDLLRTFYEHIALQISNVITPDKNTKILFTGGGTYNTFLLERLGEHCPAKIIVPDNQLIDYKEALIFGLLAVLHQKRVPNCLSSVTGARKNNVGGVYYSG